MIKVTFLGDVAITAVAVVLTYCPKEMTVNIRFVVHSNLHWESDLHSVVFLDKFQTSSTAVHELFVRYGHHGFSISLGQRINCICGVDNYNAVLFLPNARKSTTMLRLFSVHIVFVRFSSATQVTSMVGILVDFVVVESGNLGSGKWVDQAILVPRELAIDNPIAWKLDKPCTSYQFGLVVNEEIIGKVNIKLDSPSHECFARSRLTKEVVRASHGVVQHILHQCISYTNVADALSCCISS